MALFQKKIGCVFLKETSDAEAYIEKLEALLQTADEDSRKKSKSRSSWRSMAWRERIRSPMS